MRELMSYLPEYYQGSKETIAIQKAFQPEVDVWWAARDDVLLQLNPKTATWGLRYWEQAFDLPVDADRTLSQRRSRIIARIRGLGTTTVQRLKTVVETFCPGCEVAIVEHYSEYVVEIRLTMTDEAIGDMDGLCAELGLIMPAHLGWGFAITTESNGTLVYGVCSEITGRMEVWPMLVTEIESTGAVATGGTQEYRTKLEVYPLGGMANG